MAAETILLTRAEIRAEIDITAAIPAIEQALAGYESGNDYLPPKAIFEIPVGSAWAACIVGYTELTSLLSMKLGQERTTNPARGLPTTNSWLAVFEPDTGELLMLCDGTLPTMYRTAAAAAVSTRQLARDDATSLAVIGAGQLGGACIRAVSSVRPVDKIFLFDLVEEAAIRTGETVEGDIPILIADAETACTLADVIVTATNSREPIVMADWVRPGTHLCCMGTDLFEKIECEMSLLPECRKFADVIEHALQRGEVSQAVKAGILGEECYAGSLGQVINGDVTGRENEEQITLYDGVGIGIQDTTIARTIYDQAVAGNLGTRLAFS